MVELGGVELRQVPELVAGDVGGAEREPGEVERLLAEQQRGGVGDAAGRAEQAAAQAEHLVDGVPAEHLVDGLRRAEEALEPAVGVRRATTTCWSTTRSCSCQPQTSAPGGGSAGGRLS